MTCVSNPSSVEGKRAEHSLALHEPGDAPVLQLEHHEPPAGIPGGTFIDPEQKALSVRRRRLRDVEGAGLGFRQTLRRIGSIGELPEKAVIALAVRLKGDVPAV